MLHPRLRRAPPLSLLLLSLLLPALGCPDGYTSSIQRLPVDAGLVDGLTLEDGGDAGVVDAVGNDALHGGDVSDVDGGSRDASAGLDLGDWPLDSPEDWADHLETSAPLPIELRPRISFSITEATSAQDSDYLARLSVPTGLLVHLELSGGNGDTEIFLEPADLSWQSLGFEQGYFASSAGTASDLLRPFLTQGGYYLRVYSTQGPHADFTLSVLGISAAAAAGAGSGFDEPAPDSPNGWSPLLEPTAAAPLEIAAGSHWAHVELTDNQDTDYVTRLTVDTPTQVLLLLEGGNASTDAYLHDADADWARTGTRNATSDTGRRELRLSLPSGNYYLSVFSDEGPAARYQISVHGL